MLKASPQSAPAFAGERMMCRTSETGAHGFGAPSCAYGLCVLWGRMDLVNGAKRQSHVNRSSFWGGRGQRARGGHSDRSDGCGPCRRGLVVCPHCNPIGKQVRTARHADRTELRFDDGAPMGKCVRGYREVDDPVPPPKTAWHVRGQTRSGTIGNSGADKAIPRGEGRQDCLGLRICALAAHDHAWECDCDPKKARQREALAEMRKGGGRSREGTEGGCVDHHLSRDLGPCLDGRHPVSIATHLVASVATVRRPDLFAQTVTSTIRVRCGRAAQKAARQRRADIGEDFEQAGSHFAGAGMTDGSVRAQTKRNLGHCARLRAG